MKLIVGLGNPSQKYEGTRHNVGFTVIDVLAEEYHITVNSNHHKALCGKGWIAGESVLLAKPLTYMNLSGESVRPLADYYKVEPEDILIIYDDISLEPGKIRVRAKGSAGGHNGLKSIIAQLHSDQFPRLKMGVGQKPHPDYDLADWVLGKFSPADAKIMNEAAERACDAIECLLSQGMDKAMSKFN